LVEKAIFFEFFRKDNVMAPFFCTTVYILVCLCVFCRLAWAMQALNYKQIETFASSPAFVFPQMIPEFRLIVETDDLRKVRIYFSTAEDKLVVHSLLVKILNINSNISLYLISLLVDNRSHFGNVIYSVCTQ